LNAHRWEEIQASFDELVELNASERAARLATLASTDAELHRALESMLESDSEASARLASIDAAFLPMADHPQDPLGLAGRTISHFDVHEALGAGGMGVVYRADDTRLGRAVALKFLLPHYSLDASAKSRFLREAHATAALDHPNLCTVYEVGTSDEGWLFLAMALYQGETLRARLTRDGSIPVSEALEIARQIAEGLQAAHAAGIVHRDLKPGNVMLLPDGKVRILDFGLAKARDQSISETGARFGTVSYMSPEQIRGENVDGRADQWALGVALYEMLTGRKPFRGDEELAIAHAILHDEPDLLSTRRGDISAALEGFVLRLLQKDPARRYASAADVLRDLARSGTLADGTAGRMRTLGRRSRRMVSRVLRPTRMRLMLAVAGLAVLAAGYPVLNSLREPTSRGTGVLADAPRSIAILPFTNVGGDSTNLPFSDGIADELTTELRKIDQLDVMARTSAFNLKRKGLDAREIGRQLRVQYVLEGSVRRASNRRRVRADLIDVASGKEVWSDNFENDTLNRDAFAVEDSIARSIVRQLLPHISRSTMASAAKHGTESPEAHDLYVQGRYFFERRDSTGLSKAQRYFERAISKDTTYALAYTGLADAFSLQSVFGYAFPRVNFPKAKVYATRARALDSTLAEVHTSLAFISLFYDWNLPAARAAFQKAVSLNPSYAPAHLFYAWYFTASDSMSAAIREVRRAVELDPFSSLDNVRLASVLFYDRQYAEALDQAKRTSERDPNYPGIKSELARAYLYLGKCDEALAVLDRIPANSLAKETSGVVGYVFAKCGHRSRALAELDRLRARVIAGKYTWHFGRAMIHSGLGNNDEAIGELEKAFVEREWPLMVNLKQEPAFDGIRSDPRFVAIVRKVGPRAVTPARGTKSDET
jgi:serine/threonine protein kinase/TolB-like protein/tetratricopeptide (TPR) repeat protein